MSIYITRIIEVNLPCIKGKVYQEKDLDKLEDVNTGDVYKVSSDFNTPYRIYNPDKEDKWVKTDKCDYKWHLVKYWVDSDYGYGDENEIHQKIFGTNIELRTISEFTNNGGAIRDKYLSKWEDYKYADRGIPTDVSDECKEILHPNEPNYCWGHTYVTLNEWTDLYCSELEKFKSKIKETIIKSELKIIDTKLDKIYNKVSGINDTDQQIEETNTEEYEDEYEDSFEYIFDDEYSNLGTLQSEIVKVSHIVEQLYGYVRDEDVRINYYFS